MIDILFKIIPFFALIALGYGAVRVRLFSTEAAATLTTFVFYFALSAMLFRFTASLSLAQIFDVPLLMAYLGGTAVLYLVASLVARLRGLDLATSAVEAQCSVIGNTGFLGVPMLALLLGPDSIAPMILILCVDLIVFSSLLTILVTLSRGTESGWRMLGGIGKGLLKNPMIVSICLGLVMSALHLPMPTPVDEFLKTLGAAATPGALFAIGVSLASKSAERMEIAAWLSFAKLILHPALVAVAAYLLFPVEPFKAQVAVAAAALPVAGNVFILAQHYGVAPQRVSASILISTSASVLTISAVIALLASL